MMLLSIIPLIPAIVMLIMANDNPTGLVLFAPSCAIFVGSLVILAVEHRRSRSESNKMVDAYRKSSIFE